MLRHCIGHKDLRESMNFVGNAHEDKRCNNNVEGGEAGKKN